MTRVQTYAVGGIAIVVLVIAGIAYFLARQERVAKIEKYLTGICASQAVNSTEKVSAELDIMNRCDFANHARASSLASLSDYDLYATLTKICRTTNGAISNADRLSEGTAALDGHSRTDEDICQSRVREVFPDIR